jgi:hypothetical protein
MDDNVRNPKVKVGPKSGSETIGGRYEIPSIYINQRDCFY